MANGTNNGQMQAGPQSESIRVVIRCRPMNEKEIVNGYKNVVNTCPSKKTIELRNPKDDSKEKKKMFIFDAVYDSKSTQEELYNETVQSLVASILEGYSGTIFAYGQTGTGKTYTMEGFHANQNGKGIIPRSFNHIYNYISQSHDMQYLIRTSYLEIYNEEIRDLLHKNRRKTYELREAPGVGVYVKDLPSFVCKSAEEIEHIMHKGSKNRSIGSTNMNDLSSRSHAIFMITIEMRDVKSYDNIIRVGKLNLIDLAGSERQSKSGATGERLKEASKINLSLSALGNVISALVDDKSPHVPYRDSKLTRILQDFLGGNSKTIMVANIGPASYNYDETLMTLRYANRAKNIQNEPKVNEDPKDALLRDYQLEITRLKGLLAERTMQRNILLQTQVDKQLEPVTTQEREIKEENEDIKPQRVDKEIIQKELEMIKELLVKEKLESEKLETKITTMESKLLCGGKDILVHTKEQRKTLDVYNKEIAERKRREDEIKQKLELHEESALEIRDTNISLQEDVKHKTNKLNNLYSELENTRQHIRDVIDEFNSDRRNVEEAIAELLKHLMVRYLIIDNFIPPEEKDKNLTRACYDENASSWYLLPRREEKMIFLKRSAPKRMERRPVSDYYRLSVGAGRKHRFGSENVLTLDLDIQERTTLDYTVPAITPGINALLERAMEEEEDVCIDAAPLNSIYHAQVYPNNKY